MHTEVAEGTETHEHGHGHALSDACGCACGDSDGNGGKLGYLVPATWLPDGYSAPFSRGHRIRDWLGRANPIKPSLGLVPLFSLM